MYFAFGVANRFLNQIHLRKFFKIYAKKFLILNKLAMKITATCSFYYKYQNNALIN